MACTIDSLLIVWLFLSIIHGSSTMNGFDDNCLGAHNKYRAMHGSPPLSWSQSLAADAQKWAEHLADSDLFEHDPSVRSKNQGENLAWFRPTRPICMGNSNGSCVACEEMVNEWYDEVKDYDFNVGYGKPGKVVLHFTQVVWKATTELGVGTAVSRNKTFITVARYHKFGNKKGEFKENVLPLGSAPPTLSSSSPSSSPTSSSSSPSSPSLSSSSSSSSSPSPSPSSSSSSLSSSKECEYRLVTYGNNQKKIYEKCKGKPDVVYVPQASSTPSAQTTSKTAFAKPNPPTTAAPTTSAPASVTEATTAATAAKATGAATTSALGSTTEASSDLEATAATTAATTTSAPASATAASTSASTAATTAATTTSAPASATGASSFASTAATTTSAPASATEASTFPSTAATTTAPTSALSQEDLMNTPTGSSKINDQQHKAILLINLYRTWHNANALIPNTKMTQEAQRWAEHLSKTDQLLHDPSTKDGENIARLRAGVKADVEKAVNYWYDEGKKFDFSKREFSKLTGHFSQLVWKSSKEIGIGIAPSKDKSQYFVVARFKPPGNIRGKFDTNVDSEKVVR